MVKIYCLILFLVVPGLNFAQVYKVDHARAEVSGENLMTSYTGVSNDLKGQINPETKKVHFQIRLTTIDTDNDLRNKHMNEALETEKYPEAEFSGQITSAFDEDKEESQLVKVRGEFSIHGKTNPIEVNTTLQLTEEGIRFFATWPIRISEYGIERPGRMFMKVDDKHTISIRGILHK